MGHFCEPNGVYEQDTKKFNMAEAKGVLTTAIREK